MRYLLERWMRKRQTRFSLLQCNWNASPSRSRVFGSDSERVCPIGHGNPKRHPFQPMHGYFQGRSQEGSDLGFSLSFAYFLRIFGFYKRIGFTLWEFEKGNSSYILPWDNRHSTNMASCSSSSTIRRGDEYHLRRPSVYSEQGRSLRWANMSNDLPRLQSLPSLINAT